MIDPQTLGFWMWVILVLNLAAAALLVDHFLFHGDDRDD